MTSVFEKKGRHDAVEAILVSVRLDGQPAGENEISLNELSLLLETAGGREFCRVVQNKDDPDPATFIGSGKVAEIRQICEANGISLVVFDAELSPSQIRNLEKELGGKKDGTEKKKDGKEEEGSVRVIDRTMLILDIFALHAQSAAGKMQVELAQLKYTIPRLTGKGTELSRLGGGIGTRGPGESRLESDRRHLHRRIEALTASLASLEKVAQTKRKQRENSSLPLFAIAGYTNAGKSTLLNKLTDAGILAENKLFATLDPTTRAYTLPNGEKILLTDTVGFIRNLPHQLIKAFRSTLDEVVLCDAILLVIDSSDPNALSQKEVTESLLCELGAGDKPVFCVYNKCDLPSSVRFPPAGEGEKTYFVSARTGEGLEELIGGISAFLAEQKKECAFVFPLTRMDKIGLLYRNAVVLSREDTEEGVFVRAIADAETRGRLSAFLRE